MPTPPAQYHNPQQRQPYQGYQPVPPLAPMNQSSQSRPRNPYKRYNNWNYCWTHGHDINDNHNSTNCHTPAQGHVWHATKQNTCGGNPKGQHKVMYPTYPYSMTTNTISNISTIANNVKPTSSLDDDQTIRTSNKLHKTHALLDSGATDHFIALHSNVDKTWPTTNKINVVIPDGQRMSSTKECNIDWPALPQKARTGNIIPALQTYTLISVVKLCDAGCDVIFRHHCCMVIYQGKIIMYGVQCPRTRLWMVPLSLKKENKCENNTFSQHHANSIHHMANQRNLIEYLHQCFFSPPASTLIKAVKNDQLLGVPGFTLQAINKWLPTSTATIKGHLHRTKQNLRTTKKKKIDDQVGYTKDMNPVEDRTAPCEMFCFTSMAQEFDHTMYSDATGKFPVPSYHGNRYVMIIYLYGPNAILVRPMKNREKQTMVDIFTKIYTYLAKRKLKPDLHVMDNECSKLLAEFIEENNTKI